MDSELVYARKKLIVPELDYSEPPAGSDRRAFMMRSAMAAAIVALGGRVNPLWAQTPASAPWPVNLDPNLHVVKNDKGPVMTLVDEFYKVGPGPSSSHTIGPMRITYDFYQRAIKLPADQLAQATALKVHLFGSLSATGKGHGTERAALAGLIGNEPATIDPAHPRQDGRPSRTRFTRSSSATKTINASLKDIIYDAPKGDFHHPNTMTVQAAGRRQGAARAGILFGRRRLHRVEGLSAAQEEPAEISLFDDGGGAGLHASATRSRSRSSPWRTRLSISGRSEAEINAFLDKIIGAMRATVKTGLAAPTSTLPGPIKLKTKAGDVYKSAMNEPMPARKAHRPGLRRRACRLRRKCARPSGHHRAHRRLGRRHAGGHLFARTQTARSCPTRSCAKALLAAPSSAICASTTRRLPRPKAAARPRSASLRRWARRRSRRRMTRRRRSSPTPPKARSSITSA